MVLRYKLDHIRELLEDFPVVAITGARQVGKTTLAKSIIDDQNRQTIFLDLESPRDENRLTEPELFFERYEDHLIIIDEVQRRPDLFPIIRAVIDKKRKPGRFLLLGSASPVLIRESSESLAGRIAYEELLPLTLPEVKDISDTATLWLRGGFPEAFLAKSDKYRLRWLEDYIFALLERDLPLLGLNTDVSKLKKCLMMIAHQNGQLMNLENMARSVGVTSTTISRYLDFLEYAYIIRRLMPWHKNVKKRLVKSPKVYIRDSGLLHALMNISDEKSLFEHPVAGGSWEGFVIQQLMAVKPKNTPMYFYRTHQGAEADLLFAKNDKPEFCIDIKLSTAPKVTRGFINVIEDNETKRNYLINPGTDQYPVHERIDVLGLDALFSTTKRLFSE